MSEMQLGVSVMLGYVWVICRWYRKEVHKTVPTPSLKLPAGNMGVHSFSTCKTLGAFVAEEWKGGTPGYMAPEVWSKGASPGRISGGGFAP